APPGVFPGDDRRPGTRAAGGARGEPVANSLEDVQATAATFAARCAGHCSASSEKCDFRNALKACTAREGLRARAAIEYRSLVTTGSTIACRATRRLAHAGAANAGITPIPDPISTIAICVSR